MTDKMIAVQGNLVESSVIAGALFDFIGFLTTRDKNTTFGVTSLAAPAVDLLSQWAETRKLHLDGADVKGWQDRICKAPQPAEQQPTPDVTQLVEIAKDIVELHDRRRVVLTVHVEALREALETLRNPEGEPHD